MDVSVEDFGCALWEGSSSVSTVKEKVKCERKEGRRGKREGGREGRRERGGERERELENFILQGL